MAHEQAPDPAATDDYTTYPNRMIRTTLTAAAIAISAFTSVSAKPAAISPKSLINGKKPPGTVAGLVNTKLLIDTIRPDGMQLSVTRGTRLPGTRVAIHVHEFGGFTCIISGEITDFVEGKKDAVYGPGDCYYMPPNTPMTAANLGDEPVVLIDSFAVPPSKPVITKIEPDSN